MIRCKIDLCVFNLDLSLIYDWIWIIHQNGAVCNCSHIYIWKKIKTIFSLVANVLPNGWSRTEKVDGFDVVSVDQCQGIFSQICLPWSHDVISVKRHSTWPNVKLHTRV